MEIAILTVVIVLCALMLTVVVAVFKRRDGGSQRELQQMSVDLGVAHADIQHKNEEIEQMNSEIARLRTECQAKGERLAAAAEQNQTLLTKLNEQKNETEQLQQRLTAEFENIANKITKERAAELSQANEEKLQNVLRPFAEHLGEFKQQVKAAYEYEVRDKNSLKEEVRKLTEINARMSEEANNLTKALKGDVKKQGNWGEIILERVLEAAGLTKGREYDREVVVEGAQGETFRPDVIVYLPENKHIIIDSKVSLVAYERITEATDETALLAAQKEHIVSLKKHVDELAAKNYQNAIGVDAPDFVLMFVPIEASFAVAVQADQELFAYAWNKKIVIVSPTTLLATLRTVASIWKQEKQTKNALEIARLSGTLYDKLCAFLGDMEKINKSIAAAQTAYGEAFKKLADGKGNAITTAEKIRELGAKTTKQIPENLIDSAQ